MSTNTAHYQMFINGKHVDSEESDGIYDPATETLYATVARGSTHDVDTAVAAARAVPTRGGATGGWGTGLTRAGRRGQGPPLFACPVLTIAHARACRRGT